MREKQHKHVHRKTYITQPKKHRKTRTRNQKKKTFHIHRIQPKIPPRNTRTQKHNPNRAKTNILQSNMQLIPTQLETQSGLHKNIQLKKRTRRRSNTRPIT